MTDNNRELRIKTVRATLEAFPVLAGRVTDGHAEHIVSALEKATLDGGLKVGSNYRTRAGDDVKIISVVSETSPDYEHGYRFVSRHGTQYKTDGRWHPDDHILSPYDIVECTDKSSSDSFPTDQRLEINRNSITEDLGYLAALGQPIRAIKLYRSIFGIGLTEAKNIITKAKEEALSKFHFPGPKVHSDDKQLRNWIEQEIRLAMQQENSLDNGLDRGAVAHVRTRRILTRLDTGEHFVGSLTEVPAEKISEYTQSKLSQS